MKDKSVLTFYYAENVLDGEFNFKNVWDRIIYREAENIRCINVYHCDMSEAQLTAYISNLDSKSPLMSAIASEHAYGASFMFVAPEVGNPSNGFLLDDLLLAIN